jgi:hypothetical protein
VVEDFLHGWGIGRLEDWKIGRFYNLKIKILRGMQVGRL